MDKRDLSLAVRVENVRDPEVIVTPIHFSNEQIITRFRDSMSCVKEQFAVAETLLGNGDEIGAKTIWRSQVVLAEGLLDFYLHEVSKYCMFKMFCDGWEKTDKYANFKVPMSKVEKAISTRDSNEWFFEYLNEWFSNQVFLSSESMRDQLNLIGVEYIKVMVKAFPKNNQGESKKYGDEIVSKLFKRRNRIAHQNDRDHATAEQEDITKEFVEEYIGHIEKIIESIFYVIEEKDALTMVVVD